MRPARLELSGFTAFRDSETIDFADADLFALVGPTGAGKTSIIDAMCFALYGTVPRLDRRVVAPVISVGKVEARIRFDFTVGDRAYTAARVVRRSGQGASTAEARLERDGEVRAGDADGVTKAVEALLGLTFEQFTTCVVLPQGDFARFLRDTPKGRQELLIRLLSLDVYRRMGQVANQRAAAAGTRAQAASDQLDRLAGATPEAITAAEAQLARLRALQRRVDAVQPQLDELLTEGKRVVAEGKVAGERAERLATVAGPPGIDTLAQGAAQVTASRTDAERRGEEAETRVRAAEDALAGLPGRTEVELARRAHAERARLAADLAGLQAAADRARAAAAAARSAREAADRALDEAHAHVEALRRDHAAADLACQLVVGEPCPVCLQPVTSRPDRPAPAALAEAIEVCAAAAITRQEAAAEHERQVAHQLQASGAVEARRSQLAELDAAVAGHPDPDTLDRLLAAIDEAEAAAEQARAAERAARAALRAALQAERATEQRLAEAWRAFDAARDRVAALDPPATDRADLVAAWSALVEWARQREPTERAAAAAAGGRAAALREAYARLHRDLAAACAECGVPVSAEPLAASVLRAVTRAEADLERLRADVARAAELRAQVVEETARQQVAHALGRHLKANRFERWLLDEALQRLVEGASVLLRQLSSGQYSLGLDAAHQFQVVDHRNADERRPARTLSGGETFLASLALALALADHLAELAAGGGARLESIFLDEGFGTLDSETLDVVTVAIEELGSRGRTVGLITHVRELADRVPVRFEVRRTPSTSVVQRVER